MSNITIGRYTASAIMRNAWSGWIEGTSEDGRSWILFLGAADHPDLYFGHRDETGGVLGEPIVLR